MSAPFERRSSAARRIGTNGFLRLALRCARNVYDAADRRMPEARALAVWLGQNASAFGLADTAVPDDEALDRAKRRGVAVQDWRKIGAALEEAETYLPDRRDAPIDRWLGAIADSIALDPLETEILNLALHYRLDQRVERLFDALSECRGGPTRLHRDAAQIALLLNAPTADVDTRLTPDARLQASGMLRLQSHGELEVLERLTALLRRDISPVADLYDQLLGTMTTEPLPWDAFAHLGREAEVAAAVLRAALTGEDSGVNILLYGLPGTGKTSFAATLAAQVGARLRPVAEADDDGDEPGRHERLAGLRLAQRLAASRNTLLLFDEAEDLFVSRSIAFDEPVVSSRVFIHRLLERMAVPVIWTANDISVLGPTVLRRMTMCVELKVPNLITRTRLWRQMGDEHGVPLPEADAARLARLVPAAPAVASTALRAARLAGGDAETARVVVEGLARAVRGGRPPAPEPERYTAYDPALVNADCDLAGLVDRLVRPGTDRAVSFLLSGPAGSGKSAWVRYLAERMGLQVVQKRASDVLNPFLGGSERNIADAFAEARDTNAFLVFDEADSLLLDRADAVRSWEISRVNEMPTWMEQHALPFACTTNLPERLDRASLRRFVVKVRFDWLTQPQVRLAFQHFFGVTAPPVLDRLRTLTPSDFALLRRRAAVVGAAEAGDLARLLAAECDGRIGGRLAVGFAAKAHGDGDGA
jgi:transitional endoplasmic reticulum ATPase